MGCAHRQYRADDAGNGAQGSDGGGRNAFRNGTHKHLVVIGKDTRLSGYMLEPALTAGFITMGMDVVLVGPLPTPAIAMLTRSLRADMGVVISASHNLYADNGIKLFGRDGYKLSDEARTQDRGEPRQGAIQSRRTGRAGPRQAARLTPAAATSNSSSRASRRVCGSTGCASSSIAAHGAAYKVAPTVFWELGAEVFSIGVSPDGMNINREWRRALARADAPGSAGAAAPISASRSTANADGWIVVDERGRILDDGPGDALITTPWRTPTSSPAAPRRHGDVELGLGLSGRAVGSACTAPRSATAMSSRECAAPAACRR